MITSCGVEDFAARPLRLKESPAGYRPVNGWHRRMSTSDLTSLVQIRRESVRRCMQTTRQMKMNKPMVIAIPVYLYIGNRKRNSKEIRRGDRWSES